MIKPKIYYFIPNEGKIKKKKKKTIDKFYLKEDSLNNPHRGYHRGHHPDEAYMQCVAANLYVRLLGARKRANRKGHFNQHCFFFS